MLRVGTVPYRVARPLDSGLEDEPDIELSYQIPAELVDRLRTGELDVALVSSIELFRTPGYSFLDGIGVAGRGVVSSVQVFLRKPIGEVRTVALDPASRAAATLSRVIWPDQERQRPLFLDTEWGCDPRRSNADAWLRIGDPALRELHAPDALPTFNPSEAWGAETGLPFIFATWIAAPGVPLEEYAPAFARSRAIGAGRIEEVAAQAAGKLNVPLATMQRYFREECWYEPGMEMLPALYEFRDRAARLGLCWDTLTPRPVTVPCLERQG